jgi:dihydroorotate dehydrogenase
MPSLHLLDPEESHRLSIKLLKYGISPKDTQKDDYRLATNFKGLQISNPIGLAAGYDKNGEAVDGLFNLGFGMVEIGSVTPKPQPGNPLPRFFRLPADKAVINRYGFNSEGHEIVFERLMERIHNWMFRNVVGNNTRFSLRQDRLLGVNLGTLSD